MRKIGINTDAVRGLSDEQYVSTMAELGFEATFGMVCGEERQRRLAELCAARGIVYDTLHAPFRDINTIWHEGEDGEAMLRELIRAVDHCVMVGAPIAVVHLSSGENAPPVTDIGRARFARLVEYAASRKVKIAFENQRKLANLAWAMETFDDSVAGFCWDCGHEACFTPGREYMPLFGDRLICTHLHDNSGVYNGDDHLIPMDGALDLGHVAEQIRRSPFRGTLMLEVIAGNSERYNDISPVEYLERAAAAAKKLARMVDGEA